MSDCETVMKKLEELLRDELCAEESQPIREHLDTCTDCRAEEKVCVTLTEAVQRACREKAPAELRDEILSQLRIA